jgi:hypothetical protein
MIHLSILNDTPEDIIYSKRGAMQRHGKGRMRFNVFVERTLILLSDIYVSFTSMTLKGNKIDVNGT